MTARTFFYASAGVFLLVAAYTMGTRQARADFNPQEFPIIGFSNGQDISPVVLRADGTVWRFDGGWHSLEVDPLPIPVSEVAFFDWRFLASKSGQVWRNNIPEWESLGQVPAPTVHVEGKTWSGVKEGYRKK